MKSSQIHRLQVHALIKFMIIIIMIAYPPFLSFSLQPPIKTAFSYFAADTFYYLAVADHSMVKPFYTFDGIYPTNGFHPLWQYYLTLGFKLLQLHQQEHQIVFTFYSSIVLVAIGTGLIGIALDSFLKNFALTVCAVVPGYYYFLVAGVNSHLTNQWSFMNGMETPLSLFFFGIFVYLLFCKQILHALSRDKILWLSFLLTALTLARLDDIFLFIPFAGVIIIFSPNRRARFSNLFIFLGIPVICIGGYLLYNFYYCGLFLPISGMAKGGIALLANLKFFKSILLPNSHFLATWLVSWRDITWHVLQLLLPIWIAIGWCTWYFSIHKQPISKTLFPDQAATMTLLAIYVILKGGYNFFNVYLWHQGQWYFPVSIIISNMMMALFLKSVLQFKLPWCQWSLRCVAGTLMLLSAHSFTEIKMNDNTAYFDFWQARAELVKNLQELMPGVGIVEFDDGIMSYSLRGIPVMSGFGFSLDKEAYRYKQKGDLLTIAYQRNFRIWATLWYGKIPKDADHNPDLILSAMGDTRWKNAVIYRDPASDVAFIRFTPK